MAGKLLTLPLKRLLFWIHKQGPRVPKGLHTDVFVFTGACEFTLRNLITLSSWQLNSIPNYSLVVGDRAKK